jgi:hypothetical protein
MLRISVTLVRDDEHGRYAKHLECCGDAVHSYGMSDHPSHAGPPQSPPPPSAAAQSADPNIVDPLKKYDTVVSSGQSALRALFTLNGGATIAFLTFLGHLWDRPPSGGGVLPLNGGSALVFALQLFIYGSFFSVLAYGTIFLTNCLSTIEWKHARWKTIGKVMFAITVILGAASIVCFLAGSWQAVAGFESVGGLPPGRTK